MAYTNIPKPGAQTYTSISRGGNPIYDDISITYDDPNTFYDGVNANQYTNISKPGAQTYTNIAKPT